MRECLIVIRFVCLLTADLKGRGITTVQTGTNVKKTEIVMRHFFELLSCSLEKAK